MRQRHPHDYDDIIHLPRPISKRHAPMSLRDRAGQFAPFSALTGLHEAADRTARLYALERDEAFIKSALLDKADKDR